MSEKTLKFTNIKVNTKEFHKSKQPIDLSLVTVDQIVVSDKFKHSDDGFKYFIGYQEGEVVKQLCICILLLKSFLLIFGISSFSLFAIEHIQKHGNHRKF